MKRIYTMLGAAMMLLAVSCTDKDEFGLSEFVVNTEFQQAENGAKVNFTADGLWWEQNGDYLYINGTAVSLAYDDNEDKWKTSKDGENAILAENGNFNVIYKGGADANPRTTVGYDNGTYTNVDFTSAIPLSAQTNNNNITLIPCCAVIRIVGYDQYSVGVTFGSDIVVTRGNIDCSSQSITSGTLGNQAPLMFTDYTVNDYTSSDTYVVIPIIGNSVSTTISFSIYETPHSATNGSVTLEKGKIYTVTLS